VLIKVEASSVNNTDINTRIGWYSKSITGATSGDRIATKASDASWSGEPLQFPRIQGADCYGEIVAVGQGVMDQRIGEKVLVRTLMRARTQFRRFHCWTFGSECDGGFAQYVTAPSADVFAINSDLSAEELGALPCSYSTAEGMLVRAEVGADDHVAITGASGGVGSAAVQLAKLRGAQVTAIASPSKHDAISELGADAVLPNGASLRQELQSNPACVIVDLVGGAGVSDRLASLRRGGRYATAGAIAGAIAEIDLRTIYLNDLTLFGCTAQEDEVFENLVSYVNAGRLKPRVAALYPLSAIREAQERFLKKDFVGKIALMPQTEWGA
jgi:NADPH:quinone reductase-like Zn-dependent oxidoreductase